MLRLNFSLFIIFLFSGCLFQSRKISADEAYKYKHYAQAVELYKEKIEKSNQNIYGIDAYRLAKSYEQLMEYSNASLWYQKAYRIAPSQKYGVSYANALRRIESYQKAISIYQKVLKDYGEYQSISRNILLCRQAISWNEKKTDNPYKVSLDPLSSNYSEYSPFYYNEQYVVFSSDRKGGTGDERYTWTGNPYSDIYIKPLKGGAIETFNIGINSNNNEGSLCFTKDGKELFFTRCDTEIDEVMYCKIMSCKLENGFWTEPKKLIFFPGEINVVHPCLIESDSVLVFAASPEDSRGGYDLYYSVRGAVGWSEVFAMPDYINSIGNEKFPTSHNDTLYFSSDFLPGMGNLDIFKTYLKVDNKWSLPINLEAPINSGYDDFSLVVDPSFSPNSIAQQTGLFVSNRIEGKGKDDIYRFLKKKPEILIDTVEEEVKKEAFNVFVLFTVSNNKNMGISNANILLDGKDLNKSDDNGKFFLLSKPNTSYSLIFSKTGYLNKSYNVNVENHIYNGLSKDTTINILLVLEDYQTTNEIILKNIYYDFDKYNLRVKSKESLDILIKLLVDNPSIIIELASHTDCKGEKIYNKELSQNRAQVVIDYLIQKGITSERLTAVGYGESKPINNCICEICSDEANQENRRTSFKILK